ncbi:MAG: hypothetical protein ACRCWJ_03325 [Casimicrobium sp.]
MSASQFPPLTSKPSDKRCTNCSSIMSLYSLPGHYGQTLDIDVCLDCNAIWFDQWESTQLSPDGVVALFQLIHERGGASSTAGKKLNEGLRCVTCGDGMKLVTDRVKNTRFVYQSCFQGHGRLTTFYNFLSEKQFVRELTPAERTKLCATVKQVQCSSCGAPVDLAKHDACSYCRAPISVFDRDAAKKAIDHYLRERQKHLPSQPPQNYGYSQRHEGRDWDAWDAIYAADLATDLLWALGRAAGRGLSRTAVPAAGGVAAGGALAEAASESAVTGVSGGLLEAIHSDGAGLSTATDALFGPATQSAGGAIESLGSVASERLGGIASDALPSATDALFGGGASDLFDVASGAADSLTSAASDVAGSAIESMGDGVVDSIADVGGEMASSAGEGVVDLVADGIGSLIGSIFN